MQFLFYVWCVHCFRCTAASGSLWHTIVTHIKSLSSFLYVHKMTSKLNNSRSYSNRQSKWPLWLCIIEIQMKKMKPLFCNIHQYGNFNIYSPCSSFLWFCTFYSETWKHCSCLKAHSHKPHIDTHTYLRCTHTLQNNYSISVIYKSPFFSLPNNQFEN